MPEDLTEEERQRAELALYKVFPVETCPYCGKAGTLDERRACPSCWEMVRDHAALQALRKHPEIMDVHRSEASGRIAKDEPWEAMAILRKRRMRPGEGAENRLKIVTGADPADVILKLAAFIEQRVAREAAGG